MIRNTDSDLTTYYDRTFILVEKDGEKFYIPLVLKGNPHVTSITQHNWFRIRKQKSKHWFRVRDASGKFFYREEELESLFLKDLSLPENCMRNNKPMSRNEYVSWMMSGISNAATEEQHRKIQNDIIVYVIHNDLSRSWHRDLKSVIFNEELPEIDNHEIIFADVSLNKVPIEKSSSLFVIVIQYSRYFVKFSANKIYHTDKLSHAKFFKSEEEVFNYINKYSDKYFGDKGFEIREVKMDGDNFQCI